MQVPVLLWQGTLASPWKGTQGAGWTYLKGGQIGTLTQPGRRYSPVSEYTGLHTARGSSYPGSWRYIGSYHMKTVTARSSVAGSLHLVTAAVGTATDSGTYYSARIGAGTYLSDSWREAHRFVKAVWQASGSSGSGKGTLIHLTLGRQV